MHRALVTHPPSPPAHLCKVGRRIWTATCTYLVRRGLLHSGDLATVSAFCQVAARHRALELAVAQAPIGPDGKPHPATSAANGTAAAVAKLASMLGLGPVTRGRLGAEARKVEPEAEDDPTGWADVVRLSRRVKP
jgi:P27 family predicted phage terminase small subunit